MAQPKDKKKKVTEKDPSKYINVEPILDEAQKGTAVFAWGRMNPMTAGHEKLVQKVASVAKAEKGIPHVFLTHSFDKKKNPLAYDDKIKYAQKAFGDIVKKSSSKTIFQLMKQLNTRFNRVILVAGSDRVKEFNDTLNKYNGKEYKFDEIRVVSAGARDPDADDVSGISGTKMRGFAVDDMDKFKKNLPKRIQADAEEIASLVRKGMNMSESEEIHIDDMEPLDEALTRQQRRQRSLLMRKYKNKMKRGREKAKKRTATLDVLKKRARKEAITSLKQKFAKNRRYAELSYAEKEIIDKRVEKISKERIERLAKKLLPKVKERERSRKISMAKGGSTNESLDTRFEMFLEDYYKGVPKDKKDDREAHFKRHAEKPSDGPDKDSNYKPAPGDFKDGERVKTKLSKHTKKYRDMFGEETLEEAKGLWGTYVTKKPHMLMDKNNKPKFDGRFKMFKKKNMEESTDDLTQDLMNLIESTEDFVMELDEDATASLKKKAEKTGMPLSVLRQVYNRGVAAWKSGHRPGTTPEQWGHARVNSFVTKSSGTWGKADKDLASKVRGSKKNEEAELEERSTGAIIKSAIGKIVNKKGYKAALEYMKKSGKSPADVARMYRGIDARTLASMAEEAGAGEEGTDKLVKKYKEDTPFSEETHLFEEPYDVIRDYMAMGYSRAEAEAEARRRYPDEFDSPKRKSYRSVRSNRTPTLSHMRFYNVKKDQETDATRLGLKKTKGGKWALAIYDTSGRTTQSKIRAADDFFGKGKDWKPKK